MKNRILYICIISSILPLLDSSIINITLEPIGISLQKSIGIVSWVVTSYIIGTSICIPLVPFLSKKYGSLKLWKFSIFFFLVGSLICSVTNNFALFIIGRVIQGVSAGLLIPLVQVILIAYFGKENARSTMALVGIPAIFAPAVAPLLGSIVTEYLSWRILFIINIPIIIHALILSQKVSTPDEHTIQGKIIFIDIILISIGYTLSLFSIFQIHIHHSSALYLMGLLLGVLITLLGFYVAAKSQKPSLKISLFKINGFSFSVLVSFLVGIIFNGFLVLYPIVSLQKHQGIILIGVMLAIQGVGSLLARMIMKAERVKSFASFYLIGIGLLLSALSTAMLQYNMNIYFEGIILFVRGIGMGVATMTILSAPFEWIPKSEIADGASISRMFQQVGGAIGIILSTLVMNISPYIVYGIFTFVTAILCFYLNNSLKRITDNF